MKPQNKPNYSSITYSASENTAHVLNGSNKYSIVKDAITLNDILDKLSSTNNVKAFDADFFKNQNLLVIEGGINSKVDKLNISKEKVNVVVYCETPLTTLDSVHDYTLHLIPIEKNIENVNVDISAYPDKVY